MSEYGTTMKSMPINIFNNDDEIMKAIRSAGLVNHTKIERTEKFFRVPVMDPYNGATTNREYIFFTKPDLHIFEGGNPNILNSQLSDNPIFIDALRRYPHILKQLQLSASGNSNPFIPLLTNNCKSSMDIPGISSDDMTTSKNLWGTGLFYRESSMKSDQDFDFSLEFEDTKYLEVYMFFKLFDEYERLKYEGSVEPPNESYIVNKTLHDQMSVWKVIVGEDLQRILFIAKGYGVYPKMVPRDSFSDLSDGAIKFTVNFKGTFIEDTDPTIFSDFNSAVSSTLSRYASDIPFWDNSIDAYNAVPCNIPYIKYPNYSLAGPSSIPQYELRWR